MDRQIVYPGSIPLDTDLLTVQRNVMTALGALSQATLGFGPVVEGLSCSPTSPAGLAVIVGPGSLTLTTAVDGAAFGTLPSVPGTPLVKTGINLDPILLAIAPPQTAGKAIAYLVQARFVESDAAPLVLPYYNAANPTQPYSGPSNSGAAQATRRVQSVQVQAKPGVAVANGFQSPPAPDDGWIGLWTVTVANGQSQIAASDITRVLTCPVIPFKLPELAPGFSRMQVFTTPGVWTVPAGVVRVKIRLVGGGGGGGGGDAAVSGGGGGAGGYAEGVVPVVPGSAISVAVGRGGTPSEAPSGTASINAGDGGTSSFGSFMSANGGHGGTVGTATDPNFGGGLGGTAVGGTLCLVGGDGTDGNLHSLFAGNGGASAFGGGGRGGIGTGYNGRAPGSGGGGCYQTAGLGGIGAPGIVIIEY